MSKLLLVVGMPGCGKGAFIDVALSKGYTPLVMGDIVREETCKRGYGIERSGHVAQQLRKENGIAAIAHLALERIDKDKKYIIDGIRGASEVELFKTCYDSMLIAVHSSPDTRYRRLRNRGRDDDPSSKDMFFERDKRELGFGIGAAIALADIMIINEGSEQDFKDHVKKFLEDLDRHED